MAGEVSMDYDAVEAMADGFNTAADVLKAVSVGLEIAINALRAANIFTGVFGGFALQAYLENIKPKVDTLQETCDEMSNDLNAAVVYLRDGDESAQSRFV